MSFRLSRKGALGQSALVLLLVLFTMTACTSGEAGKEFSEEDIVEDGKLAFGLSAEPSNLYTGQDAGVVGYTMYALLHRGLVQFNEEGEVVEALPESYEQTSPTEYVFNLRDNLEFSNGEPLTAETVKANLEFQADSENSTFVYPGLSYIHNVQVPDQSTVEITLSAPNNAFLEYLAVPTAGIVPEDSLDPTEDAWIGAGPFEIESVNSGQNMILKRNELYYAAEDVGLSELDLVYYEDGNARTNALVSGEVDLIDYVPWEDFERVERDPSVVLDSVASPFMYVHFNVDDDGPMSDPLVREAVAHAVNRDNVVDAVFFDNGDPVYGMPLDESDPNDSEEWAEMYDYDPEKSKDLLDEAGYDYDQTLTLLTSSQYTFHQDTALTVQADLEAVGIKTKLSSPDWATRISEGVEGNYDIAVAGNSAIVPDTSWISSYVGGPVNYSRSFGYENDTLSEAVKNGVESEDESERQEYYDEARELMVEDTPIVMLSTRAQAYAYNDKVGNFVNYPGFLTFYSGYALEDIVEVQR